MSTFPLKIVTPDGLIYDGSAERLIVRSTTGDLAIMARHIIFVTPLGMGIATVCMFLAWRSRNRRLFYLLTPFYVFLCLSTVYIQAHYVIDALAGLVSGVVLYYALLLATARMKG